MKRKLIAYEESTRRKKQKRDDWNDPIGKITVDMVKKALLLCSTRSYLVSIKDLRLHIIQKFGNCSKIKPNICITWFTEEHEEELQLALNECSKGKWAKISRKGILSSENKKIFSKAPFLNLMERMQIWSILPNFPLQNLKAIILEFAYGRHFETFLVCEKCKKYQARVAKHLLCINCTWNLRERYSRRIKYLKQQYDGHSIFESFNAPSEVIDFLSGKID